MAEVSCFKGRLGFCRVLYLQCSIDKQNPVMCVNGEREGEGGGDRNISPQGPFRSLKKSRDTKIFKNAKYSYQEKPKTWEDYTTSRSPRAFPVEFALESRFGVLCFVNVWQMSFVSGEDFVFGG